MGKRLVVILGAGASYDLIPAANGQYFATANWNYRPPLTSQIFVDSPLTEPVLDHYPGASDLAVHIRRELYRDRPLEEVLLELSKADHDPVKRQFLEVPLYLQELLGTVSTRFTTQPYNYQLLLSRLAAPAMEFERVAIVTLNYDSILDHALAQYFGDVWTMDTYMNERFLYVKLHGSVNWARRLDGPTVNIIGFDLGDYLQLLRQADAISLSPHIEIRSHETRLAPIAGTMAGQLLYPALSVPLGTYQPVCPQEHLRALEEFLRECDNVLVVGCSGKDGDLLEILRNGLPERLKAFMLVDNSRRAAIESRQRFAEAIPMLGAAPYSGINADGFSTFVIGDGLDEFIAHCG
jgi:hypothetical protein